MIRATKVLAAGDWSDAPADSVTLAFDDRHRRRMAMCGEGGLDFLLDLPKATAIRGGDGLWLEDGRIIAVISAPEELIEIAADNHAHLVRIAWHLGNRHLPTQLMGETLRIRRDHVIEDMVQKLGGKILVVSAPFDPEGGAYGHGSVQGHDHAPDHSHAPAHSHSHGHHHHD